MGYLRKFFDNLMFSIKTVKSVSPLYFYIRIAFICVELICSYGMLFLWRNIINTLTVNDEGSLIINSIIATIVAYASLTLFRELLGVATRMFSYRFNDSISFYLDSVMINKTADCDIAFFDSAKLRKTMRLSWRYVLNLQSMSEILFDAISNVTNLVISVTLLSSTNLIIVPIVILTSIPFLIADHRNRKLEMKFNNDNIIHDQKMEYYCDLFINENTRHEIRINQSDEYIIEQYKKVWEAWNKAKEKNVTRRFLNSIMGQMSLYIGEISMYILSVTKLTEGAIAVGDVSYFISLLAQFRGAFTGIFSMFVKYDDVSKKIDAIREFLEMEKPMVEKSGDKEPTNDLEIEFRNVSFKYPGTEKYVLKNCTFKIDQGETFGLVGLNGAGKSTIVKLLLRFYDPTEGSILINGIDIREYEIVKLRKLFGVLFQDYVKYSLSFRENIALSDIENISDSERVLEACRRSRALDFIHGWEKGIDENMTRRFDPNGKELSGGQWQRVSLARAFFRDAPIVLLDEPSAALDPIAEHRIFQDFTDASKGKSAMLISHRLSSITLADKILVLNDGHIIEQGTHKELMEQNGEYARLFNLQAEKYT